MTAPQRALKLWGLQIQLRKLAEECAELAVAALHLVEERTADREDHLCEEIADVEIMIEGMRAHFGDVNIDRHRAKKIARLEKRLAAAATPAGGALAVTGGVLVHGTIAPLPASLVPGTPTKYQRKPPKSVPEGLPAGYLTVKAAALAAGITIGAARSATHDGRLPSQRIGAHVYVSRDDALAYALKARSSTRRRGSAA